MRYFKLKFHTSATTTLESYEIIALAQLELNEKKYNVDYVTDKSIAFKDNLWRLRWSTEPYMLDEGELIISDNPNGGKLLTLNYCWEYYQFLLAYGCMLIVLISDKAYEGIWFFSIFYVIVIPIDILRAKSKAKQLLANVLKADT